MSDNPARIAERNQSVDIIRGIAILLVILGHTMTGCVEGSENSFLFNVVWSLQIPLFVLISGFVTRYSRKPETAVSFWRFVKRRTISYILPWLVWTFFVRGVVFQHTYFFKIGWLLCHMDAGYWFLTTIWTINIVFGVSVYLASIIARFSRTKKKALIIVFYCIGMGILFLIGFFAGMSFFGIRLTLYYMPFYFIGYLYGELYERLQLCDIAKRIKESIIAICFVVWVIVLIRVPLYTLLDTSFSMVLLRVSASLVGSIAICDSCPKLFQGDNAIGSRVGKFLREVGIHSMEMYITHISLLTLIRTKDPVLMSSAEGASLLIANYVVTLLLTITVIKIVNTNRILRFVLYGNGAKLVSVCGDEKKDNIQLYLADDK